MSDWTVCISDTGGMKPTAICGKEVTPESLVPMNLQRAYMSLMRGEPEGTVCPKCKEHFAKVFSPNPQ